MAKATPERIIDYPASAAGRASGYVVGATSTTTLADHDHEGGLGSGGTLDHGTALTGLADNDHPQYGLVASPLSQFAATTSAQLAGVLSDETGTGAAVFGTLPTFTTALRTPVIRPVTDSTTAVQVQNAAGTSVLNVDTTNARVGIGTTAPLTYLHVVHQDASNVNNVGFFDRYTSDTIAAGVSYRKARGTVASPQAALVGDALGNIQAFAHDGTSFINGGNIRSVVTTIGTNLLGMTWQFRTRTNTPGSLQTRMVIADTGNVGIGTTAPATPLHVVGAATITGGIRPAADSTTALQFQNAAGTAVVSVDTTNARVGIGTTSPTAVVHIKAGTATASTAPLKLTTGTVLTTAEAGAVEYNNTFHLTESDGTRRHVVVAASATKTTAGAPYTNDGFVTVRIGGTDVKVMTTA